VADLAGIERAGSRDELVDALAGAIQVEPWRVAVDALDEAATAGDLQQLAETLTELAALPALRVAVATRPLAVGDRERYLSGGVLFSLGVAAATSANLVDLDTDSYFDPAGLELNRPGSSGE
jgi:hypothetical protein